MKKNNILIIVLVLLIVAGGVFFASSVGLFESFGGYVPSSVPYSDKVVKSVNGYLKCEYTQRDIESASGNFVIYQAGNSDDELKYYAWDCPSDVGSNGCSVKINRVYCEKGEPTYANSFITSVSGWVSRAKDGYTLYQSQNWDLTQSTSDFVVTATCVEDNLFIDKLYPIQVEWTFFEPERGIYVLGSDYAVQGLLAGSTPDCDWISSNYAQTLINRQPRNEPIDIATKMVLGQTEPIIVGWREVSGVNLNPMGKFRDKNIVCTIDASQGGATIKEANDLYIVDNTHYYIEGSVLASGANYCCGGDTCSGNLVCNNYECELPPDEDEGCALGQCYSWQRGDIISKDVCDKRAGLYYLVTTSCDENLCKQETTKQVKCCLGSCPDGFVCDYSKGCIEKPDEQDECPEGYCCSGDHTLYFEGGCPAGVQCCWDDDASNDPELGVCKSVCETIPNDPDNGDGGDEGDFPVLYYILIIFATGILGVFIAMQYIDDKKIALLVAFGLIILTIGVTIFVMDSLGMSPADLTLRVLACGGEKKWWENIPVIGLFGCNGRLDQVIGITGAILLTAWLFSFAGAIFTAQPLLLLISAIIGYLVSTFVGDFIMDSWYLILLGITIFYVVKTALIDDK